VWETQPPTKYLWCLMRSRELVTKTVRQRNKQQVNQYTKNLTIAQELLAVFNHKIIQLVPLHVAIK
jgi:hypothetical protein